MYILKFLATHTIYDDLPNLPYIYMCIWINGLQIWYLYTAVDLTTNAEHSVLGILRLPWQQYCMHVSDKNYLDDAIYFDINVTMQHYPERCDIIYNITDRQLAIEIAEQTVPPQRRHQYERGVHYASAAEAWEVKRLSCPKKDENMDDDPVSPSICITQTQPAPYTCKGEKTYENSVNASN